MKVDEKYIGKISVNTYELDVGSAKDDVIVIAKGRGPMDDPDIYVSFKDAKSATSIEADIKCTSFGIGIKFSTYIFRYLYYS